MPKGLEKIVSSVKRGFSTAVLAGALAIGSGTARAENASFTYWVGSSPQIENREGRFVFGGGIEKEKIKSIGKEEGGSGQFRVNGRLSIEIESERNFLKVRYELEGGSEKDIRNERIPASTLFSREDSARTHIYFLLPSDIPVKGMYQKVKGFVHKSRKEVYLYAVPLEDSSLGKRLATFNKILDKEEARREDINELERALDNLIGVFPVKVEIGAKFLKNKIKKAITEDEKKRIKRIQDKYPEYNVIKMPFYQENGDPFDHTNLGREWKMYFDSSKAREPFKAYLVVDKINYQKDIKGTTKVTSVFGLEYEIKVDGPKKDTK